MNRLLIVGLMTAFAVVFSVSLLRFAHDNIVTHSDGTVSRTLPDDPVITTYTAFVDFVCIKGQPCPARAAANFRGLYAREGVPRLAAILAGIVLPMLFLIASIAITVQRRWVSVLGLCAAALALYLSLTYYGNDFIETHWDGRIEHMIKGDLIHETRTETGVDPCLDGPPCKRGSFAFVTGLYAAPGVPKLLAILGGLGAPILLIVTAVALAVRPRLFGYK